MKKEKIYEIEPFNRFALGGCFEYGYIPAFSCLGGSQVDYFLNTIVYYRFIDDNFCVSSFNISEREELERKFSIESYTQTEYEENIVDVVLNSLIKEKLVMLRVSGAEAYEIDSLRKTEKSFSEHWMLCYGYDLNKEEFYVLEHLTNISAFYKPCRIKFENLKEAYEINKDGNVFNLLCIWKNGESILSQDLKNEYIMRLDMYKDKYELSRDSLLRYLDGLKNVSEDNELPEEGVLLTTEVIKGIQREQWLLDKCGFWFDTTEVIKLLNLVRTFQTKCDLYPSDRNYEMLRAYAVSAKEAVQEYYKYLINILE